MLVISFGKEIGNCCVKVFLVKKTIMVKLYLVAVGGVHGELAVIGSGSLYGIV
jgi:hypothetical protein